jgi:hypothetical protein
MRVFMKALIGRQGDLFGFSFTEQHGAVQYIIAPDCRKKGTQGRV